MNPMRIAAALLALAASLAAQDIVVTRAPVPTATTFDMEVVPSCADPSFDFWNRVPTDDWPTIPKAHSLCRGQMLQVIPLFRNIGDTGNGVGRVTLSLWRVLPDGTSIPRMANGLAWDGEVYEPGVQTMAMKCIELQFGEADPLGPVRYRVTALDAGSGATVERTFDLSLEAWNYGSVPASSDRYLSWLNDYHRLPLPAQAVRAFVEYAELWAPDASNGLSGFVVGFFRALFTDHAWLVPHLVESARGRDEDRLFRVATLLHLLQRDELVAELYPDAGSLHDARSRLAAIALPDPYEPLATGLQVDLLWGEFFATGRYRPVRQIVRALDLLDPADPVDVYNASAKTEADKAALERGLAVNSAASSLGSNMEQHLLVQQFGLWMLKYEQLAPRERDVLRATLELVHERQQAQPADGAPR